MNSQQAVLERQRMPPPGKRRKIWQLSIATRAYLCYYTVDVPLNSNRERTKCGERNG